MHTSTHLAATQTNLVCKLFTKPAIYSSLPSMYRGQILPGTLPRVQTNSCLPELQISINLQNNKMQRKPSLILSSDYFHILKIPRKMPVKYIQYFQMGVGLDGSELQRSYQVHPSSGILLFRYYNHIANPFQSYQWWKLNLNNIQTQIKTELQMTLIFLPCMKLERKFVKSL